MDAWSVAVMILGSKWVMVVAFLLAANVVMGTAVSMYRGVFQLGEVGTWLRSRAVPYLMGGGVAKLAAIIILPEIGLDPKWGDVVWLWAIADCCGHLIESFRELGMPLPAMLGAARSDALSPPLPTNVPKLAVQGRGRKITTGANDL